MTEAALHTVQNTQEADLSWAEKANCEFVEQQKMMSRLSSVKAAKEVCRTCTVRQACLDYALSQPLTLSDRQMVWGGLDKWELMEEAKVRQRAMEQERLTVVSVGTVALEAA